MVELFCHRKNSLPTTSKSICVAVGLLVLSIWVIAATDALCRAYRAAFACISSVNKLACVCDGVCGRSSWKSATADQFDLHGCHRFVPAALQLRSRLRSNAHSKDWCPSPVPESWATILLLALAIWCFLNAPGTPWVCNNITINHCLCK